MQRDVNYGRTGRDAVAANSQLERPLEGAASVRKVLVREPVVLLAPVVRGRYDHDVEDGVAEVAIHDVYLFLQDTVRPLQAPADREEVDDAAERQVVLLLRADDPAKHLQIPLHDAHLLRRIAVCETRHVQHAKLGALVRQELTVLRDRVRGALCRREEPGRRSLAQLETAAAAAAALLRVVRRPLRYHFAVPTPALLLLQADAPGHGSAVFHTEQFVGRGALPDARLTHHYYVVVGPGLRVVPSLRHHVLLEC